MPVLILKTLEYLDFDIKVKSCYPRGLWRHRPLHSGLYLLRLLTDGYRPRTINSCHSLCWRLNERIMIKRLLSGILNKSIKTSGGSSDSIRLYVRAVFQQLEKTNTSVLLRQPASFFAKLICLFSALSFCQSSLSQCNNEPTVGSELIFHNSNKVRGWFGIDCYFSGAAVQLQTRQLKAATSTRLNVILVSAQIITISYMYFSACKWGKGANQIGIFERICK